MLRADYLKLGRPVLMRGATLANGPRSAVPSDWGDWRAAMQRDDFLAAHGGRTFLTSAIPYGPLNYRTAARTLFLRPYLVFSRFSPSWRQDSRKWHQKTGGRLRNGRKRPRKEWSPPTYS